MTPSVQPLVAGDPASFPLAAPRRRRQGSAARLGRVVLAQREIACADPEPWRLFELAVDAVQAIVGPEGAAAAELVHDGLVVRSARGTVGPQVGMLLPIDTSLAGAAIRARECLLVTETRDDPRGDPVLAELLAVRSAIIVPLVHDGVPVAVLSATSSRPGAFDTTDRDLLMLIADVTSARLAHALALFDRDRARVSVEAGVQLRSTLFDAIGDGIVVQDATGQIVMANPAAERVLGLTSDQLQGRTNVDPRWRTVRADGTPLPGDELPAAICLRTGEPQRHKAVGVHTPEGELRWLSVTAVPMSEGNPPEVVGAVVSFTDVTADHAAAEALRASEQHFRLAFDNAPIGMVVSSLRPGQVGHALQANGAFGAMIGHDADDIVGLSARDWTWPEDLERDELLIRRLADGDTDRLSFEKRFLHRDGHIVHAWVEEAVAYGSDGRPLYSIAHCLDVTERRQAQEELRRLSLTDTLTGLANRTLLEDRMRLALARLSRTPATVALLLVDLDRFKVVNDSLGHELGNTLLMEAARRLLGVTRAGTTVARLGGDEFVVFLDGLADAAEAEQVARRLVATLREPYQLVAGGEPITTTASVGIAVTSDAARTAADLLREADLALYRAKDAGRDRTALYDDELQTRVVARLDAEHRLRRAIEGDRLVVLYQPVLRLSDGLIEGVEALVRIEDPDVGLVAPAAFIEVAEDTGLIVEVDAYVVAHAVAQLGSWRAAGLPIERLAVNVSARSLDQPRYAATLARALAEHGVPGSCVQIELTERTFLTDNGTADLALRALHELGVHVGIDDFGTGYSALAYLQRFDLDFMKIDRSFVARLGTSLRDDAVVAAIVDLGHAHSLYVVAEGVEEADQLVRLRGMGCDSAQGYYMGRPMTAAALARVAQARPHW